ncbi:zinc finger protein 84-like isoform X2 [Mastacembelus armatus]|uniref:zinc finger protein 84-like isoform X2 n=1 Tax=Mastacembelus armatus TaxID=205130 RepID=UPI0014367E7D|nr:zinc finger protein 84-like isoform X2 [Mastacembelus armatus]
MSRLQSLKLFVSQRLNAAVEEIFGHLEKTISDYEEELDLRHRELLHVGLTPETKRRQTVFSADLQQLLMRKEEVPLEQQDWSQSLDQDPPEPPHIKEDQEPAESPHIKKEQEEVWTSQEGEQLQGLEEAGIIQFPLTPVPVKTEDDHEEKAQFSQLHQSQTEDHRDFVGGDYCGRPEPVRSPGPHRLLQSVRNDKTLQSSEPETENSDHYCKETGDPQPVLNFEKTNEVSVSHLKCKAAKKSFVCCECGRKFGRKDSLRRHMRYHTGEKPYSCSVCGQKQFSCGVCDKRFTWQSQVKSHKCVGESSSNT